MKMLNKTPITEEILCLRCGDPMLPEEISDSGEFICAICEQMRNEALQIRAERLKNMSTNPDNLTPSATN